MCLTVVRAIIIVATGSSIALKYGNVAVGVSNLASEDVGVAGEALVTRLLALLEHSVPKSTIVSSITKAWPTRVLNQISHVQVEVCGWANLVVILIIISLK